MPPKKSNKTEQDAAAPSVSATGASNVDKAQQGESNRISGADEKYKTGPFSLLYNAVHVPGTQVLILCRNQKRIFGRVRAFDRHFNMLLEDAQEIGTDKDADGNPRTRGLPKLFLRGDSVISVVSMKK